jgi:RNase H-like domain found in reverse transcriptase/Reverse transcriptase (RNA-dependent DNA polymerase)/Retroviral aspartyl protease
MNKRARRLALSTTSGDVSPPLPTPRLSEPLPNHVNIETDDWKKLVANLSNVDNTSPAPGQDGSSTNVKDLNQEPLMLISVLGKEQLALLDSGSSHSFIGVDLARELRAKSFKFKKVRIPLNLAEGHSHVEESVNVHFTWEGNSRRQRFFVLPDLNKAVILGRDFLSATKVNLNIAKGGWTQGDEPQEVIPFAKHDTLLGCCNVEVSEAWLQNVLSNVNGSDADKDRIERVLRRFMRRGLFSRKPGKVKGFQAEFDIDPNAKPYRARSRPTTRAKLDIMDELLDEELEDDIIEPCFHNLWASCPVLVKKKSLKKNCAPNWRLCIDLRRANTAILAAPYELPRLDYIFAQLGGSAVYSVIDMSSGYNNIEIKPEHRDITAFITPHRGSFRFKRLCFGIKSGTWIFQRLMDQVLEGLMYRGAACFVDDVILWSKNVEEHAKLLEEVLGRLSDYGFHVNLDKIQICCKKVKVLGHIVSDGTMKPDPEKVRAIHDYPVPQNKKHIQQWMGMLGFFRVFIKDLQLTARPITSLLRKDTRWKWGPPQQSAFDKLKAALTSDSVLMLPRMDQEFIIQSDASTVGIGAVLMQKDGEAYRPVAFTSRTLTPAESNYCITELECLSLVNSLAKFKHYIAYQHCTIWTDHAALKNLMTMEDPSGRIRRWALRLMGQHITIEHRKGSSMHVADALSRAPCGPDPTVFCRHEDEILPIGDVLDEPRLKFKDYGDDAPKVTHTCERCTNGGKTPLIPPRSTLSARRVCCIN